MEAVVPSVNAGSMKVLDHFVKFNFHWKIDEFSTKCEKVGDKLVSPFIEFEDINLLDKKMQLSLYPFGKDKDYENNLSLDTKLIVQQNQSVCMGLRIRLKNIDGSMFKNITMSTVFSHNLKARGSYNIWGWPTLVKRDFILKNESIILHDDTLIIEGYAFIHPVNKVPLDNIPELELAHSFKLLFKTKNLSDVTITIEDKNIEAHKSILAARSPVFHAMFSSNMKENNEDKVNIEDIDYNVMEEMLYFIYCGTVRNINEFKIPLLKAADKYDLESLKLICERALQNDINLENYCEIIEIVKLHDCKNLRSDLIEFVVNHAEIIESEEFEKAAQSDFKFLKDIMMK